MFEINLIKERVVPISRKILRTFIVTAYYTLLLFGTLVILIMSYSEESRITQKLREIQTLEEDFIKHKADQERYDENVAKGSKVYVENETIKAPWMSRVNFAFIYDILMSKWQDAKYARFMSITHVDYDADFALEPGTEYTGEDKFDKVYIYGKVWDNPQNPGIKKDGSFNPIQEYTDDKLKELKDLLLTDPNFLKKTNIATIEIESNPNGYLKGEEQDKDTCYFRIIMAPKETLVPRPEAKVDKNAKNNKQPAK